MKRTLLTALVAVAAMTASTATAVAAPGSSQDFSSSPFGSSEWSIQSGINSPRPASGPVTARMVSDPAQDDDGQSTPGSADLVQDLSSGKTDNPELEGPVKVLNILAPLGFVLAAVVAIVAKLQSIGMVPPLPM